MSLCGQIIPDGDDVVFPTRFSPTSEEQGKKEKEKEKEKRKKKKKENKRRGGRRVEGFDQMYGALCTEIFHNSVSD